MISDHDLTLSIITMFILFGLFVGLFFEEFHIKAGTYISNLRNTYLHCVASSGSITSFRFLYLASPVSSCSFPLSNSGSLVRIDGN